MSRSAAKHRTEPEEESLGAGSPWDELDADGTGLSVEDFLTTRLHLASNALRQALTLPYVEQFGLTMPEWRILSVLAHCGQLPFTELVVRSATDKGQLSRTLKAMQERGLVLTRNQTAGGKKLDCLITKEGLALHDQLIPLARRAQAAMIRQLEPQERQVLFRAIEKLGAMCGEKGRGSEWGEG